MTKSEWGTDTEVWRRISPPFLPRPQDLELFRRACPPGLLDAENAPRILVLGMTPALVAGPWPARSEVHAVDFDQVMIDTQWQAREGVQWHCARWQEMPFADGCFDLVIGDCSFISLPGIADYQDVLREISRVSKPSAPLVMRFFMQSDPRLELATLADDAASRFADWTPLGRSLLIPIAASEEDGSLRITDIPGKVAERWARLDDFLVAMGQPPEDRELLAQIYQLEQRLNFPSEARIRKEFGPWYPDISFAYPDYDCGAFCPIVRCLR